MSDLIVSAEVSIYPLRQEHLSPAIAAVTESLNMRGLQVVVGSMSTHVVGATPALFAALGEAFVRAAETGHVVMTVTVSNACPIPDPNQ